jgi:hypothetical protein
VLTQIVVSIDVASRSGPYIMAHYMPINEVLHGVFTYTR